MVWPLCKVSFRLSSIWGHINHFHITHSQWPEVSFLEHHHRLVYATCKFNYHEWWKQSGCCRPLGMGKLCRGQLCCPSDILTSPAPVSQCEHSSQQPDISVTSNSTGQEVPVAFTVEPVPVRASLPYSDLVEYKLQPLLFHLHPTIQ